MRLAYPIAELRRIQDGGSHLLNLQRSEPTATVEPLGRYPLRKTGRMILQHNVLMNRSHNSGYFQSASIIITVKPVSM